MQVIAAYPCLGKTTLGNLNKDIIFDREFNESRSTLGMTDEQVYKFFMACANIICLQMNADYHKVLFITEDERLLTELDKRGIRPILVFPDVFSNSYMEKYKKSVVERSGIDWWNRVLEPEMPILAGRILQYMQDGYDVRLTDARHPYIQDVVELPENIITPDY